jgi:hypothetical protein
MSLYLVAMIFWIAGRPARKPKVLSDGAAPPRLPQA